MTVNIEWLSLLGAGVSGVAAAVTIYRIFARAQAERALVDLLKHDKEWQSLLTERLRNDFSQLSPADRALLLDQLRECMERLDAVQRIPVYEGLKQDSAAGRRAYLAKLAAASAC
jgi:hypothetical protein